jgi:hypothetical protein
MVYPEATGTEQAQEGNGMTTYMGEYNPQLFRDRVGPIETVDPKAQGDQARRSHGPLTGRYVEQFWQNRKRYASETVATV